MTTVSTSLLRGSVKDFRFHRFALRVIDGLDKGKEYVCSSAAEVSVGTGESNSLVLTDPTVSRYHFVLQVGPQGVQLRDLDSTNGTMLGAFRLGIAFLNSGAIITLGMTRLRYDELAEQLDESLSEDDFFGRALGRSVAMRRLFSLLPRIAAADSTVLIEGETGTGKGVLAEAIHAASARAARPFVVVDCGSIPPALIESELFGHERGAFHRRDPGTHRRVRAGGRRHRVPRRARRASARAPAETPAGPRGAHRQARRRQRSDRARRARHRGEQPQPEVGGEPRHVPRRPLLSPQHRAHRSAAAARASR